MSLASCPEETMFKLFYIDSNHKGDVPLLRMDTRHFRKCKDYQSLVTHVLNLTSIVVIQSKETNQRDVNLFDMDVDMIETEYKNVDIGFFRKLLKMLVEFFPFMLRKCNVYNSPGFFPALYKLLSPLIPKETREKIHIIRKSNMVAND